MLDGNSLRHDQAPRVDDELPHLCLVDRVQPHSDPVVTQVGLSRHGTRPWAAEIDQIPNSRSPSDPLLVQTRAADGCR